MGGDKDNKIYHNKVIENDYRTIVSPNPFPKWINKP